MVFNLTVQLKSGLVLFLLLYSPYIIYYFLVIIYTAAFRSRKAQLTDQVWIETFLRASMLAPSKTHG